MIVNIFSWQHNQRKLKMDVEKEKKDKLTKKKLKNEETKSQNSCVDEREFEEYYEKLKKKENKKEYEQNAKKYVNSVFDKKRPIWPMVLTIVTSLILPLLLEVQGIFKQVCLNLIFWCIAILVTITSLCIFCIIKKLGREKEKTFKIKIFSIANKAFKKKNRLSTTGRSELGEIELRKEIRKLNNCTDKYNRWEKKYNSITLISLSVFLFFLFSLGVAGKTTFEIVKSVESAEIQSEKIINAGDGLSPEKNESNDMLHDIVANDSLCEEKDESQQAFNKLKDRYFQSFFTSQLMNTSIERFIEYTEKIIVNQWIEDSERRMPENFEWDAYEMDLYGWTCYQTVFEDEQLLNSKDISTAFIECQKYGADYLNAVNMHVQQQSACAERDMGVASLRGAELLFIYIRGSNVAADSKRVGDAYKMSADLFRILGDYVYHNQGLESFILYGCAYVCYKKSEQYTGSDYSEDMEEMRASMECAI